MDVVFFTREKQFPAVVVVCHIRSLIAAFDHMFEDLFVEINHADLITSCASAAGSILDVVEC